MRNRRILWSVAVATMVILSLASTVLASTCPPNLDDTAHVVVNPPGNDYDVWYTNDATSDDHIDDARAGWARDALVDMHDTYVGPLHNFENPDFSVSPNDTCIRDIPPIGDIDPAGAAYRSHIELDAPYLGYLGESPMRNVVGHELFHHIQYGYVDIDDWPSVGSWAVEGTASAMEDKLGADNDSMWAITSYGNFLNEYLADPNRTWFSLSYNAALFWTYIMEQIGTLLAIDDPAYGTAYGVDAMQRFWSFRSEYLDSAMALRETIASFPDNRTHGRSLEEMFRDFAVTYYTHNLDLVRLDDPDRYRYLDETAAG